MFGARSVWSKMKKTKLIEKDFKNHMMKIFEILSKILLKFN